MKRILHSLCAVVIFSFSAKAATITWIGASGSNWNNTANWSSGTVPIAIDDVVFNTSANVEMDIIPATTPFIYTINSLHITTNAAVVLNRTQAGGGTRIFRIASTSAIIKGLLVDSGSSLTMNAVNNTGTLIYSLDLSGAAGVTGTISGNLFFTGTGAGTGNVFLNLYTDATHYANLTVSNTGMIKYFANSGNTNSSGTGVYLTMQSGSVYEINKNGGSLPQGSWDNNSTILITGVTTVGLLFTQAQYGNLDWNSTGMTAVTQFIAPLSPVTTISLNNLTITNTSGRELRLKTGATSTAPPHDYTVRGNLTIAASAIMVITGINVVNAGAGARLHVMGNINNQGTLRTDGAAGTVNELELNGTSNQNISNSGVLAGGQLSFIMNNLAGATLQTSLTLPGTTSSALQLTTGKIKTSSLFLLRMLDNSGYSGGSSSSFVEGPMVKIGDDASFIFPIGKGSIYAPISFNSIGLAVTDEFTAEYLRANPQNNYGTNYEPLFDHISYVEYWSLDKTVGTLSVPVNVTIGITQYSFARVLNTTYISRYNSGDLQWKNSGTSSRIAGIPVPPNITGTLTSTPLTQLGIFTLATTDPLATNPLPVRLISFNAKKSRTGIVNIDWEIAGDIHDEIKFEVQRSENGKDFISFYSMQSMSKSMHSTQDSWQPNTINWYRVKLTDKQGVVIFSRTIQVLNNSTLYFIAGLYPNPVSANAVISISSNMQSKINLVIYNVSGKKMKTINKTIVPGNNLIHLEAANLDPGVYFIRIAGKQQNGFLRFAKL